MILLASPEEFRYALEEITSSSETAGVFSVCRCTECIRRNAGTSDSRFQRETPHHEIAEDFHESKQATDVRH